MKNLQSTFNSPGTRIATILGVIALVVSIPLVAMQFSNEVKWDLTDFIVAGALLLSTGLAIEIGCGYLRNPLCWKLKDKLNCFVP